MNWNPHQIVTRRLFVGFLFALILPGAGKAFEAVAAPSVSLASLLDEMVDVESIARWPVLPYTCKQASSYDRRRVAPDKPGWFDNDDQSQFIRIEEHGGRKKFVMLDADGPGAIVRFWLTTNDRKNGFLRIYIDESDTPVVEYPAYDLRSGPVQPGEPLLTGHPGYTRQGNGGNTSYLPIPYAKHCTVTWEEPGGGNLAGPRYYQINYRTYPAGTPVKSFSQDEYAAARPKIERANQLLSHPPKDSAGNKSTIDQTIEPKASASLDLPAGPGAVRELAIKLSTKNPADLEQTLRSTVLRISFDDEQTVWCPVGDFSGSGVGLNELHSWYREINKDGQMTCRWVMPFGKTARISLENLGNSPVHARLEAVTNPWKWDDCSMHFRCNWRLQSGIATDPFSDWNFIRATGQGVYVGDALAIFNPLKSWYGEGDEKIWVDGEKFPSHIGTGTEDYYNFSWAPKPLFQTPFANEVRLDEPMTQGHNTVTRTRNLDGIPFEKSIQFDMEIMPWKHAPLDYAATTYWYARPGATTHRVPLPEEAARMISQLKKPERFAGALECESMKVLAQSPGVPVEQQDMAPFGADFGNALPRGWSGEAHLLVESTQVGHFVEIAIPAPDDKPKRITLFATKARDYGVVQFSIDGKSVPSTYDGYAKRVEPSGPIDLGIFTPKAGRFILRAEIVGANPAAVGARYCMGFDCVVLSALK